MNIFYEKAGVKPFVVYLDSWKSFLLTLEPKIKPTRCARNQLALWSRSRMGLPRMRPRWFWISLESEPITPRDLVESKGTSQMEHVHLLVATLSWQLDIWRGVCPQWVHRIVVNGCGVGAPLRNILWISFRFYPRWFYAGYFERHDRLCW